MKKDLLGHLISFASYVGIQNLLSWKLGVDEPFNVMAATSLTFGAQGFMKPGSIRSRARNMALYSVKAGALGFPIGMIQMKLMESGIMVSPSISKSPSAENPHSVVKEDVEKN